MRVRIPVYDQAVSINTKAISNRLLKIKVLKPLTLLIFLSLSQIAFAQIDGEPNPIVNTYEHYTYTGGMQVKEWFVTPPEAADVDWSGSGADIHWNQTGAVTITVDLKLSPDVTLDVIVLDPPDPPDAPNTTDDSDCGGPFKPGLEASSAQGSNFKWYTAQTGGTYLGSGSTYSPLIAETTSYWVSVTNANGTSARSKATGYVYAIPAIPGGSNNSRCGTGSLTLTASAGANGDQVKWFTSSSAASSHTPVAYTGTSYEIEYNSYGTTTYYLKTYNSSTGCWSSTKTITATIKKIPNASASNKTICSGSSTNISISNPNNVSGTTYGWTASAQAGIAGASNGSGSLINQTLTNSSSSRRYVTYTVKPSASGCGGSSITVKAYVDPVSIGGTASADASQICGSGTVNLSLTGERGSIQYWRKRTYENGTWGGWENIGNVLTDVLGEVTSEKRYHYYAIVENGVCSTAQSSTTGTVYHYPVLDGGYVTIAGNPTNTCSGTSLTINVNFNNAPVSAWKTRWKDGAGSWSAEDLISTSPGSPDYTVVNPYTGTIRTYEFWAVVDRGECTGIASSKASITVDSPSDGGAATSPKSTYCSGEDITINLSGFNGSVQQWYYRSRPLGGSWGSPQSILATSDLLNRNHPNTTGQIQEYEYWAEVKNGPDCNIDESSRVVVMVYSELTAGTIGFDQDICEGGSTALITNQESPGGGVDLIYQWQESITGNDADFTDIPGETILEYQPPVLTQTTWYRRVVNSGNSCGSLPTDAVKITIRPYTNTPTGSAVTGDCGWGGAGNISISVFASSQPTLYYYEKSFYTEGQHQSSYPPDDHPTGDLYIFRITPLTSPSPSNRDFYFRALESGKCLSDMLTVTYPDPTGTPSPPTSIDIRNGSGEIMTELTICSGSTTTLYAGVIGGSQGSATYEWFSPGGTSLGTSSSLTYALSVGLHLLEVTWNSNCGGSSMHTATIDISYFPEPNGGIVSSSQSVCDVSELTSLTVTGTSGTIAWYRRPTSGGPWEGITSNDIQAANLLSGYEYKTEATNECDVVDQSKVVTIFKKPDTNTPTGSAVTGDCGWKRAGNMLISVFASSQPTLYYYKESFYTEGQHQSSYPPDDHPTGDLYIFRITPLTSPSASNRDFYFRALEPGKCISDMLTVTYPDPTGTPSPPTSIDIRNGSGEIMTELTLCIGSTTTLYSSVNGGSQGFATYKWFPPGGGEPLDTTPSLTGVLNEGLHLLEVTWNSNCGGSSTFSTTLDVNIDQMPDAGSDGTDFVCSIGASTGSNLVAALGGAEAGGTWTDDNGSGVDLANPSLVDFSSVTAGDYNFTYTVIDGQCSASAVITVTVGVPSDTPSITAASVNPVCESVVLSSTITASGYEWYIDGELLPGENQENYTATTSGDYTLIIIDTCPSEPSVAYSVQVAAFPEQKSVSLTGPSELCETESTALIVLASQDGIKYRVMDQNGAISASHTGDGLDISILTISLDPSLVNPVTIEASDPITGCITVLNDTYTINVSACAKPEIRNIGVAELEPGQSTTLEVVGTYSGYQWRRDGINIMGATNLGYTTSQNGIYSAEVTYANGSKDETPVIRVNELEANPDGTATPPVSVLPPPAGVPGLLNYIETHTAQKALSDGDFVSSIGNKDQVTTSTQFFDGLGRPVQTVARQASPNGFDLIQPIAYDVFGRVEKEFLPYATSSTTDGGYQQNALLDQYNFYQESDDHIANSQATFAWKKYEQSPLNRVLEHSSPGDAWYPGANFDDPGRRTVKFDSRSNNQLLDGNILIWDILASGQAENSGFYLKGELLVSSTTDEHESRVQEFVNKQGQTILKRVEDTYQDSDALLRWLETYYVYDDFGKLRFVLPPEATKKIRQKGYTLLGPLDEGWEWVDYDMVLNEYLGKSYLVKSGNSITLGEGFDFAEAEGESFQVKEGTPEKVLLDLWAFQYRYDSRNRMIAKKVPGADWVYMIYDQWDRLALTQDGNQRLPSTGSGVEWLFTKYDALNRPIMTGIYVDATDIETLRNNIMDGTVRNEVTDGSSTGYTLDQTLPLVTETDLLSVTYYDDYSYPHASGDFDNSEEISGVIPFYQVKGQVTGSKIRVLDGTGKWLRSTSYYDDRYRVIQTITESHASTDRVSSKYDFVGNIISTKTSHRASLPVDWDNLTSVDITNGVLTQTSAASAWTAGASSVESISEDGYIEWPVTSETINSIVMIGFTESDHTDGWTKMKFGFYMIGQYSNYDRDLEIYESGSKIGHFGKFNIGDVLKIERSDDQITYFRNEEVLRTVTDPTVNPLKADVIMNREGDKFGPVTMYPVKQGISMDYKYDHGNRVTEVWHETDFAGLKVNWEDLVSVDNVNDVLTQTSTASAWTAGGSSVDPISGDGHIQWPVTSETITSNVMIGFTEGDHTDGWTNMKFGFYMIGQHPNYDRDLAIYESGSQKGWSGKFNIGDVLKIERSGDQITYSRNDEVLRTVTDPSVNPLKADVIMNRVGDKFGPVTIFGSRILITQNQYNELGELIEKNLHGTPDPNNPGEYLSKQSVDYSYNIRGWLTAINDAALTPDATEETDHFGMELYYNDGYGQAQYNGNIAGVKWQNGLDQTKRSFGYVYDPLNRIKFGDYYAHNGVDWMDEANRFNMRVNAYDLNGNIGGLERAGKKNITGSSSFGKIDEMTYNYSGNRLISVDDAITDVKGRGDFYDGDETSDEYHYDANGNMIKDRNKGIVDIEYNYLNLPARVDMGDNNYIEYVYDASGIKLQQKVFENDALIKSTDYVGPFIYEDGVLQLIQHDEGRIVIPPAGGSGGGEYQYHLKDHLGNTRVTFTSDPDVTTFLATMESEDHATENLFFDNLQLSQIVNEPLADNDPPVGDEVYLTNEANPIGPGLFLPVIPGDRVEMSVYGYFNGGTGFTSTLPVENLTNELTMMFNAVNAGTELPLAVNEIIDDIFSLGYGAVGSGPEDDAPAAYLNYLMFDEEMNFIMEESGVLGISINANGIPEHLYQDYFVNSRGYLFMYLSNESNEPNISNTVYWDDLKITHYESPIVQVDDYYPFGLTFNSYQRLGAQKNKFLYNGKELQTDLDLNWMDYGARMYDAAIGRWHVVDPLAEDYFNLTSYNYAENNPIRFIDILGMNSLDTIKSDTEQNSILPNSPYTKPSTLEGGDNSILAGLKELNRMLFQPLWLEIRDDMNITIEGVSPSKKSDSGIKEGLDEDKPGAGNAPYGNGTIIPSETPWLKQTNEFSRSMLLTKFVMSILNINIKPKSYSENDYKSEFISIGVRDQDGYHVDTVRGFANSDGGYSNKFERLTQSEKDSIKTSVRKRPFFKKFK